MFDPNNPNPTVPDGMMATTSLPAAGAPAKPARPAPLPATGTMANPPQMSFGSQMAKQMNPGLNIGAPPQATMPTPPGGAPDGSGGIFGGNFGNMFSNLPGGLGSYLGNYMNSLFSWLNARPGQGGDMAAWRSQRPEFSGQDMRAAMFAPAPAAPAPAPVAGIAVGEPNPAAVSGLGL